jgi:hypothetical protein
LPFHCPQGGLACTRAIQNEVLLVFAKFRIGSAKGKKLVMVSSFDDFPVLQEKDPIGVSDGAEAMSDDQSGLVPGQFCQGVLDAFFRFHVDA